MCLGAGHGQGGAEEDGGVGGATCLLCLARPRRSACVHPGTLLRVPSTHSRWALRVRGRVEQREGGGGRGGRERER